MPNSEESFTKIDVPGDGSCLFWAVTLAYLIPVKNDDALFRQRYETLFGNEETATQNLNHIKNLVQNYNMYDNTFAGLVRSTFRSRVVDHIRSHENEFRAFVEGRRSFDDYLQDMRNPNTWGGEPEIRAMSEMLGADISVSGTSNTRYANGDVQIQLFHVGTSSVRNHYNFGLEQHIVNDNEVGRLQNSLKESIKHYQGGPQDFELIQLLIQEADSSKASTSTQQREDFESFQARFQSYIDQIPSYLHSVKKPGFFPHFFLGSFSTLLDTEVANKLDIRKICFAFDGAKILKVAVIKNGEINSQKDVIDKVKLFVISESGFRPYTQEFYQDELQEVLGEHYSLVENNLGEIKVKFVEINKDNINNQGISVTVEDKKVDTDHISKCKFTKIKKELWGNPEGDIAKLANSNVQKVEESLGETLKKIKAIHSEYKSSLKYASKAREAAHHGFVAGVLNNFRYRHNLRVYLEQFAGRGYADIVLLPRGPNRALDSIPIIIELKAEKGPNLTPDKALEQAEKYAQGFQPNVQRVLTTSDDILCVGVNLDYPSPISNVEAKSREGEIVPLFQDMLKSTDDWDTQEIYKNTLKKQIKDNLERIYHTFPGTGEKGDNHYFSRFLLGQSLLLSEALGTNFEKHVFIYNKDENIPTEIHPESGRPQRPAAQKAKDKLSTGLDASHAVVSMVLIPESTEKLAYVINIVEANRKDVLDKVLPLDELSQKIGNREIVELNLNFDTRYKSNFKRHLTVFAEKYISLEEYNNRANRFQGNFKEVPYPGQLKETFDRALDSQRTRSSMGEYNELLKKIGEGIWPFKTLINNEPHFQGVLNGAFSYYSDLKLQEPQKDKALILTEFQTGRGERIDMLVHGIKFEGDDKNAKEYTPIGLELKASRQGKGAKALLKEAENQVNKEYKEGVTYKTLTDGDKVEFIGVVFNKGAEDADSLILTSEKSIPVKVVHSSTLVLPTVDNLSSCLGQGNRKKRSTSKCLFSWDDIDKFNNAENVDKRNKGKIKIDNEKFLTYIKNSQDEGKNAQLIEFIGEKITPNIEGNHKYLLNEVVQDGGYVNHVQNKRIKDLQNDVLQQDGGLAKNSKLKSRLTNAAGRIQLIRGIHGAIVSCKDGTATDCGLNLGGIAWSFASQPIEDVMVKITPKLVKQTESFAGKVIPGTLGKQTKFAIRVLGVKLGTTIAKGTAGALTGVFDIVDIGRSASNLVDCKNRENSDNPCGEKEIRDNIASISFSGASFISGVALTAASMPVVGVAVGFTLMVGQGVYNGVSNIIEYEKKYDTTHGENWSIFWRTLFLSPMSLDIQALESRHSIVNSVAQEAWKALNNSPNSIVAYAIGFGNMDIKDVYFYCRKSSPKVLVYQGVEVKCSKEHKGVKVPINRAEHADIFMNRKSNAYTENLSRVLPEPIQGAEMICLPKKTSGIYEKEGTTKSVSSAVHHCENAMVIADSRRKQNGTTIVYDLRNVNEGAIIGSSELNNDFIIFKGKEQITGGDSTINRFTFKKSNFLGKVNPGQNSTNIFDFSHIKDDIPEIDINYKQDHDAISISHSGDIKDDILEIDINYQRNHGTMQRSQKINVLEIKMNSHPLTITESADDNFEFSEYRYIGRQDRIDKFSCTGNFYHDFIINSGGGTYLGKKDIIENCSEAIVCPNTNVKGGEGNYTFYIKTIGYPNWGSDSKIDVNGTGTIIFPDINLLGDSISIVYSSNNNTLSIERKGGKEGNLYLLNIDNYISQSNNEPNFVLIDKNGSNVIPKLEKPNGTAVNSFMLFTEYPLNNFDDVENHYRKILNNNKGYEVFCIVRDKVQNQSNSTSHMMFGSSGNDIINFDQGTMFARGGNGSDVYVIGSGVGKREVIIDNNSDDKKLDMLLVPEVPEEFSIQQRNLYLNYGDTRVQVKNYLQDNDHRHLIVMNSKGEAFIPYMQSILHADSSVDNGELVPFLHAAQIQNGFFLSKDFLYDHVVIDSRSEDIEQYRDKDDLLLIRESEIPFIVKIEGYYGDRRWGNVNFLLWNNGNFSYFDLPQEIGEIMSYQDKLKADYEKVIKEYVTDFSDHINIIHNQKYPLTPVEQDEERVGVIILKGITPGQVKVSSSDPHLVFRDTESNRIIRVENWDSSESYRISTLEFDLGLDLIVIRRLNRFSLSNVVEIQTLINKASENYQNRVTDTETENDFKCLVSVDGFKNIDKTYECLGFPSLQEQINFTENFCTLEQIDKLKDKIPSSNHILRLLRKLQNDFLLNGYDQSIVNQCSKLMLTSESEIVRLLVSKKDEHNNTQLHYVAGQVNNLYELEFLINAGADVNAMNIFGEIPLHMAVIAGRLNAVEFLVGKGAKINVKNNHGRTPLEEAGRLGNSQVADFLRRKQNEYDLLLLDAAKNGDFDKVKDLTARGANVKAKDNKGKTPQDVAADKEHSNEEKLNEEREPVQRKRRHHHGDHPRHHSGEQKYLQREERSIGPKGASRNIENINSAIEGSQQATSEASKPSSWIGSIVNWIKGSTKSPALLTSREHDNITVTVVPEINATLVNNTIILGILAAGQFNKTQRKQPIHENLLSPREQSMRLNNIDEDMIIRAMQQSEEFGDPDTKMDEVKISGNKTGMCKGGK